MPLTTKQIKRVLKWLRPSVQARLRKEFPELPERGRSYRLTYEDLLLIDELNGKREEPPPKPEPVVPIAPEPEVIPKELLDEVVRAMNWMASQMPPDPPPSAEIIPFKKRD